MTQSAKQQWLDRLCENKRANGYSEDEIAEYREQLDEKYASSPDSEFVSALQRAKQREAQSPADVAREAQNLITEKES